MDEKGISPFTGPAAGHYLGYSSGYGVGGGSNSGSGHNGGSGFISNASRYEDEIYNAFYPTSMTSAAQVCF